MSLATLFFIVVGAICVAASIGVVTSRNPVHSALYLLVNFATLAVLYITLDAQFLAAAQVIIYAGGIVILILFVIMLIGSEQIEGSVGHRAWVPYTGIVLGLIMLATLAYSLTEAFTGTDPNAVAIAGGGPETLGLTLYTRYILPFELTAILLLVALLGALLLGRNRKGKDTSIWE